MDEREMIRIVIRELGKHRHPSDIIKSLCERTGMKWEAVEALVVKVQAEHRGTIDSQQNIILIPFGIITVLVGLGIAISIVIMTLGGTVISLNVMPIPIPFPYLGNVAYFGLGSAMTIGGIVGLWRLRERNRSSRL